MVITLPPLLEQARGAFQLAVESRHRIARASETRVWRRHDSAVGDRARRRRSGDWPPPAQQQARQQLKTVQLRIEPLQPLGSILSSSPSTNLMTSAARRRGEQQRLSGARPRCVPEASRTACVWYRRRSKTHGQVHGPKLKAKKNQAISIVMGGHPSRQVDAGVPRADAPFGCRTVR